MKTALISRAGAVPARRTVAPVQAVKDVFMPALSSTMTEGKVVSWLKAEGDKVTKGEALVVVESDKADMDVESFEDGYLGVIVVPEGGTANVGSPIAFIAETQAEIAEAKAKAGTGSALAAAAAAPAPEKSQVAAVATADNTPTSPTSTAAAPVGPPVSAPPPPPPPPAPAPTGPAPRADGRIIATPYAKQLAKSLKVDLSKVGGTGPEGRITAADVERIAGVGPAANGAKPAAAAPVAAPPAAAAAKAVAAPAVVAAAQSAGTTVAELAGTTAPFNSLEKAVSKNMMQSKLAPEFRCTAAICTDALDKLYKELKPRGVTMSALIAKACGVALQSHPRIYASCTPDGMGITYGTEINIANAVSMADGGLITPVLKNCDTTDIYSLSRSWGDLVKRARVKQLTPAEYSGFSFTISNLGMMGVEQFDALLPFGSGAILAVGASVPTVIADSNGMIGVKKIMKVTITCDHRIIYGNHAAEFLQTLKSVIEQPDVLLR